MSRNRTPIGGNSINLDDDQPPLRPDGKTVEERIRDRVEYRHWFVSRFLKNTKHAATAERAAATSMWNDSYKVAKAHQLSGDIFRKVNTFLNRGGNLSDAYEILLSQVEEEAFKRFAFEKYNLVEVPAARNDGALTH
jgi:hypothetical protein